MSSQVAKRSGVLLVQGRHRVAALLDEVVCKQQLSSSGSPASTCQIVYGTRGERGEREQGALTRPCAVSFGFHLRNSCPMLVPSLPRFRDEAGKARANRSSSG